MFKQLFGKYLVDQKALTPEQYAEISAQQAATRVKLGLIAVEENLLTKEQADELNHLQTQMDKRFGDLAVEKGYLTEESIMESLLSIKRAGSDLIISYFTPYLLDNL